MALLEVLLLESFAPIAMTHFAVMRDRMDVKDRRLVEGRDSREQMPLPNTFTTVVPINSLCKVFQPPRRWPIIISRRQEREHASRAQRLIHH